MPVTAYTGALVDDFLSGFQVLCSITLPPDLHSQILFLVGLLSIYLMDQPCGCMPWGFPENMGTGTPDAAVGTYPGE